eukprot:763184-Hanusia_phi.AAC.1
MFPFTAFSDTVVIWRLHIRSGRWHSGHTRPVRQFESSRTSPIVPELPAPDLIRSLNKLEVERLLGTLPGSRTVSRCSFQHIFTMMSKSGAGNSGIIVIGVTSHLPGRAGTSPIVSVPELPAPDLPIPYRSQDSPAAALPGRARRRLEVVGLWPSALSAGSYRVWSDFKFIAQKH